MSKNTFVAVAQASTASCLLITFTTSNNVKLSHLVTQAQGVAKACQLSKQGYQISVAGSLVARTVPSSVLSQPLFQELYPPQSSPNHCTALNSAPHFFSEQCGMSGNIADQLFPGDHLFLTCGPDRLEIGWTNYVAKGTLLASSPLFFHDQAHTLRDVSLKKKEVNVCD